MRFNVARKPKQKANPVGRPKKTIDWKRAKRYARAQCTQEEIAGFFDMDVNTLKAIAEREICENFSQWLKKHADNGKCSLRRSMWLQATNKEKPNATMQIWLSKNYLGMQDNVQHDVSDKAFNLAYNVKKQ